jgi:nucleosome-remodeling factor subunit BPTF
MSKDLQQYICDDCRDDKLYCICQKPYNDLQFYIQCDKCDDWLHGRCVGVLQGESDSIGDYICPACEPKSEINAPNSKKLDGTDYMAIQRLVKELQSNRSSIPFRKPVTKAQAPNYYSIIKEPMDLQTVTNRVEGRQYERLLDFIADVVKIFENCRYYNDSSTDIFRHADNLEKFFVQKIWALRQNFNARARPGTT